MIGPVPGARPRGEDGTILPLVLGFTLLLLLLVLGVTAASTAFLAQRDVQSFCDSAALAAADAVDESGLFGPDPVQALPLSGASVRARVGEFVARSAPAGQQMAASARTDGRRVEVTCRRVVRIPLGGSFGYPDGLPRTAVSVADSPLR